MNSRTTLLVYEYYTYDYVTRAVTSGGAKGALPPQ